MVVRLGDYQVHIVGGGLAVRGRLALAEAGVGVRLARCAAAAAARPAPDGRPRRIGLLESFSSDDADNNAVGLLHAECGHWIR